IIQSETRESNVVHKGEIAFGTVLGVCTGYFIKKVGKLLMFMIGLGFVCLQYLSAKSYITVHWDRMAQGYNREFDVDQDGRVTKRDINTKWQMLIRFLTHNLQFKSTFLVGLYAGIRY
ncbi:FUN14 family-domain-containing protein, partial [Dichotomocladium elegans]